MSWDLAVTQMATLYCFKRTAKNYELGLSVFNCDFLPNIASAKIKSIDGTKLAKLVYLNIKGVKNLCEIMALLLADGKSIVVHSKHPWKRNVIVTLLSRCIKKRSLNVRIAQSRPPPRSFVRHRQSRQWQH